jgi:YD repeat-containing protein
MFYAYDGDGNVTTKTAPSANQLSTGTNTVVTTYSYDALNRLTGKSYNDSYTSNPPTISVKYGYDAVLPSGCVPPGDTDSNPLGNRTSMCDGSGGTSWIHDSMGRVTQERRTIGGAAGKFIDYTYNLDGSLSKLSTPPLKTIIYTQGKAGRTLSAVDTTDSINFATSATYAPPGELTGMVNGLATPFAGFITTNSYNSRLQPILLSASINAGATSVLSLCFDFHLKVAINMLPCVFSASTIGQWQCLAN